MPNKYTAVTAAIINKSYEDKRAQPWKAFVTHDERKSSVELVKTDQTVNVLTNAFPI